MKTKTIMLGAIFAMVCVYGANALTEAECDVTPGMTWADGTCMAQEDQHPLKKDRIDCENKKGHKWVDGSFCANIENPQDWYSLSYVLCSKYGGETKKETGGFTMICLNITENNCNKINEEFVSKFKDFDGVRFDNKYKIWRGFVNNDDLYEAEDGGRPTTENSSRKIKLHKACVIPMPGSPMRE